MNRLKHLQQTLPVNIAENSDYPYLEFVLLDYNSTDGLEDYVKDHLGSYIESGKLIYYRTGEPSFFHRSHSRNVAFKLASGDVLCNIDADNFAGRHFATYINDVFQKEGAVCLNALDAASQSTDILGKICITRDHFMNIKGYDESMSSYGFEDYDFVNRALMSGVRSVAMDVQRFSEFLSHSNEDRLREEYAARQLSVFLLRYIDPGSSEALFLFKDGRFKRGTIIDNYVPVESPEQVWITGLHKYRFDLQEGDWQDGEWTQENSRILLKSNNASEALVFVNQSCYISDDSGHTFYQVKAGAVIMDAALLLGQLSNRMKWEKNTANRQVVANKGSFGVTTVFRNFDYSTPIYV